MLRHRQRTLLSGRLLIAILLLCQLSCISSVLDFAQRLLGRKDKTVPVSMEEMRRLRQQNLASFAAVLLHGNVTPGTAWEGGGFEGGLWGFGSEEDVGKDGNTQQDESEMGEGDRREGGRSGRARERGLWGFGGKGKTGSRGGRQEESESWGGRRGGEMGVEGEAAGHVLDVAALQKEVQRLKAENRRLREGGREGAGVEKERERGSEGDGGKGRERRGRSRKGGKMGRILEQVGGLEEFLKDQLPQGRTLEELVGDSKVQAAFRSMNDALSTFLHQSENDSDSEPSLRSASEPVTIPRSRLVPAEVRSSAVASEEHLPSGHGMLPAGMRIEIPGDSEGEVGDGATQVEWWEREAGTEGNTPLGGELSRRAGREGRAGRVWKPQGERRGSEDRVLSSRRQQIIVWLLWNTCVRDQKNPAGFFSICNQLYNEGIIDTISFLSDLPALQRQFQTSFQQLYGRDGLPSAATTEDDDDDDDDVRAARNQVAIIGVGGQSEREMQARVLDPSFAPTRFEKEFEGSREIGSGGFGTVVAARHRIDGQLYAVKRIRIKPVGLRNFRVDAVARRLQKRVLAEARSIAKLHHPNIVRYYNSWLEVTWCSPAGAGGEEERGREEAAEEAGVDGGLLAVGEGAEQGEDSDCGVDLYEKVPTVIRGVRAENSVCEAEEERAAEEEAGEEGEGEGEEGEGGALVPVVMGERQGGQGRGPGLEADMEVFIQMEHCGHVTVEHVIQSFGEEAAAAARAAKEGGGSAGEGGEGQWSMGRAVAIAGQLLQGLKAVHAEGLMHRDVKPSNLFVTKGHDVRGPCAVVKLGDFGLATAVDGDTLLDIYAKRRGAAGGADEGEGGGSGGSGVGGGMLHTAGAGTPSYMSPEQSMGRRYGQAADVFSAGVVLMQLTCAFSTPMERIEAQNLVQKMGASVSDPQDVALPPRVCQIPRLAALLRQMLAYDPSLRPSAADALAEIEAVQAELPSSSVGADDAGPRGDGASRGDGGGVAGERREGQRGVARIGLECLAAWAETSQQRAARKRRN